MKIKVEKNHTAAEKMYGETMAIQERLCKKKKVSFLQSAVATLHGTSMPPTGLLRAVLGAAP